MSKKTSKDRRCLSLTTSGDKCKAHPTIGSDFCFFHDPDNINVRRAAAQQGGRKTTKAKMVAMSQDIGRLLLMLDCLNRFVPAFMLVVGEAVGKKKLNAIMSDKRVTRFAGLGWNAADLHTRVNEKYRNDYSTEGT